MKQTSPTTDQLWQRCTDESARAYASFCRYRDLGVQRSLVAAYRLETGRKQARGPSGEYTRRSRQYDWVARALAWDRHMEQVAQAEKEQAVRDQARLWDTRRRETREDEYVVGRRLMERAREMLEFPLAIKRQRKEGPDGTVVIEVHPAKWNLQTIAAMVDVGSRLCRVSAEMPPKVHEAPPTDWSELMFETDGQLAAALPPGAVPEMPVDVNRNPNSTIIAAHSDEANKPRQPPFQRPK